MDLRTARFLRRKTQIRLSLETGISQPLLSHIENGYIFPDERKQELIAKALGFKPEEINWNPQQTN